MVTLRPLRFAARRNRAGIHPPRPEQRWLSPFSAKLAPFDPIGDRRRREACQRITAAIATLAILGTLTLVVLEPWL